jgi:hypothetical protein
MSAIPLFRREELFLTRSQRFMAIYCANWQGSASLAKPVDRNTDRIREWISEVYEIKKFYSEVPVLEVSSQPTPSPKATATGVSTQVPVTPLSRVLGEGMVKLEVKRADSSSGQVISRTNSR